MSEFQSKIVPTITKNYENEGVLHFIVENIPVSIANALRRTILSDIPVVCIRTETSKINQCTITTNTSRFHNEIVKQRLSCIPIMTKDVEDFPKQYRLILEGRNTSDYEMKWVTTHDFKIQHKESEQFLDEVEVRKLFPSDRISNRPIDFLRLRPKLGPNIPGEAIELTAEFSVSTAKENGMFNAVSKCAYFNVIDASKRDELWAHRLQTYKNENRSQEEIDFEEKNFHYLDAYRCFKTNESNEANAFEFVIETVGQYTNYEVVEKGCSLLIQKLEIFRNSVESDLVPIQESHESKAVGYTSVVSSNSKSYDIILEEEDYTLGYLLEYYLYSLYYKESSDRTEKPELSFVGFKKYHPHDDYSVLRMMSSRFSDNNTTMMYCKQFLTKACNEAIDTISGIRKKMTR